MKDYEANIIYDHYKESMKSNVALGKRRDYLSIMILVIAVIISFQIFLPDNSRQVLSEFTSSRLDISSQINVSFLGTIIWFSFFAVVLRYIQTMVSIERGYTYIHELEDKISETIKDVDLRKEGESYLTNYPFVLDFINVSYKLGIMAGVLFVSVVRMVSVYRLDTPLLLPLLVDSVIAIVMTALVVLYIRFLLDTEFGNRPQGKKKS